ncbi:MAG: hypothetical protein A2622_06445 [Bdellovibrionales bacterium RIFCSPHIGHO2_01_FULL_40_29]|nr:MAG: hypothetical protein A2622_06445 [Bdellovibrionales bacterium RIFCSPHIGHO2_01_FULL_40_29]OFZ35082.1 MAG: hypothetical protein A3D17_06795 [Bdellovibrionales bacterium RIFCSPHIGHO2_02_FULL_40_15]
MKKLFILTGVILMSATLIRCTKSDDASGSERLTTAGKMNAGLEGAVETIQSLGAEMGTGTFFVPMSKSSGPSTLSAATKCTEHAEPGEDGSNGQPLDGTVTDAERISQSDAAYAIQKLYCTLAADTSSPESVSGAVKQFKTVICAVERTIGTLAFDGVPVAMTGITLDTNCATAEQIFDMSGGASSTSATITVTGGFTVTSSLNPTFSEIPGNTHYTHGVKIESTSDPAELKYIVVAKFDSSVEGDPTDSGDFEFATLGTGTMMQGTAIDYTAGKIYGTGATKHLWYESRTNRVKASLGDTTCKPGEASSSCGFARHIRLSTDIAFSSGDISDVSNMYAIISDGGDATGSGQTDQANVISVTGALSTGLTGQLWQSGAGISPTELGGADALSDLTAATTTCLPTSGAAVTTTCPGMPAVLQPTGPIKTFMLPANSSTWLANASTKGGLGFTGAVTIGDEQFVSP